MGKSTERPRLRAVEAFPVEVEGRRLICVRDPQEIATEPLVVAYPAFFIMTLCDGSRSVEEIERLFFERFGELPPRSQLEELLSELERLYYLEGKRAAARQRELLRAFRAEPVRRASHCGVSYPADPGELRRELDGFFTVARRSGKGTENLPGPVRGIIAPHIDPRVGGPAYASAYAALSREGPADVFVLLCTSHKPGEQLFTATYKDFATPLGVVPTCRPMLDRLRESYGDRLLADEILHRTEHSVEFQTLFLRYVFDGKAKFEVVPILVGSFHDLLVRRKLPIEDERVAAFIDALERAIEKSGKRVALVAGVDFAHIGRKFGDAEGLSASLVERGERRDRDLIRALEAANAGLFFALAAADNDSTRVCGLSAMYTFLCVAKRLGMKSGHLLHYDRSEEASTRSAVSFASLAFC